LIDWLLLLLPIIANEADEKSFMKLEFKIPENEILG
jgi:hypothetical protein